MDEQVAKNLQVLKKIVNYLYLVSILQEGGGNEGILRLRKNKIVCC